MPERWIQGAHAILLALLVLNLSACATPHTFELGTTVGRDRDEIGLELGMQQLPAPIGGAPLQPEYWRYLSTPSGDLAYRHGVDDELDFVGRFGASGVQAGFKRHLYSSASRFHLAGELLLGFLPVFTTLAPVGSPSGLGAQLTGSLVLELRPHPRLHLVASPKAAGIVESGIRSVRDTSLTARYAFGGTLGAGRPLRERRVEVVGLALDREIYEAGDAAGGGRPCAGVVVI